MFTELVELIVVEALLLAPVVVQQHLAHPEARHALELLVAEIADPPGQHRGAAQVELLPLLLELRADEASLPGRVGGADSGRDAATDVPVAALAAFVDALGDRFHVLLHKVV